MDFDDSLSTLCTTLLHAVTSHDPITVLQVLDGLRHAQALTFVNKTGESATFGPRTLTDLATVDPATGSTPLALALYPAALDHAGERATRVLGRNSRLVIQLLLLSGGEHFTRTSEIKTDDGGFALLEQWIASGHGCDRSALAASGWEQAGALLELVPLDEAERWMHANGYGERLERDLRDDDGRCSLPPSRTSGTLRPSTSPSPSPPPTLAHQYQLCITGLPSDSTTHTRLEALLRMLIGGGVRSVFPFIEEGFAFIELESHVDPQSVITALDGKDPFRQQRPLVVDRFDQPGAPPLPQSRRAPPQPLPRRSPLSSTILVSNLLNVNETLLRAFVTSAVPRESIADVEMWTSGSSRGPKRKSAFVTLDSEMLAAKAIDALDGRTLCGEVVGVRSFERRVAG